LNDIVVGAADTAGGTDTGAVTAMVTPSICVPEDETITTVPVQLVALVNPDGSTETVKFMFDGPAVKLPVGERASQLLLVQVCTDTWAVALVFVCAVTVSVCEAGAGPPTTALNVKAETLNASCGEAAEFTFRVTGTMRTPEAAFMKIVPLHVVPAAIPDGLTETVKFVSVGLAVKLPVGEIVSQLKLAQLSSTTWAVVFVLNCAVTVSVCEAGAAPPATALNAKVERLNVRVDAGTMITFRVTGTVCVPEVATIEIVPLHVVPVAIPDGLTETAKFVFDGPAMKLPVGVRVSQLLPVQLCSDTWAVALVFVCAVTVSVCAAGAAPPATALNARVEGLNVRLPEVTFRVTFAVWVPEAAVMEIVPLQVVPAANPDGSTETVKYVFEGPAVKLPVGVRVSQLLPVQLCFDTWVVALVFVCAVTVSVCVAGVPPATALNVKAEGLNVRLPVVKPATFRVTLAVCVTEAAVMEIVPLQVVPAANPDGLTETVKFVFARPALKLPVGERVSQLLPVQLCSDTWAVALVFVCAVTVSVCVAGAVPPATALNVKAEGLNVRLPAAVTSRVTLKVSDPWLELITIVLV
jgi:hypothetical protein